MPVSSLSPLTLVLGGQRSGKSAVAERLADEFAAVVYVATCRAVSDDADMAARIASHQGRRPGHWTTVEAPLDLAGALLAANGPADKGAHAVLVDSIGMWVANLIEAGTDVDGAVNAVLEVFSEMRAPVIMVSEETGLGIIPDNALARGFIDALGTVNQKIAARADQVLFVAAGQILTMK